MAFEWIAVNDLGTDGHQDMEAGAPLAMSGRAGEAIPRPPARTQATPLSASGRICRSTRDA